MEIYKNIILTILLLTIGCDDDKNDLFNEILAIVNAGNKKRIPITIVEGKKNIPKRKKIKP